MEELVTHTKFIFILNLVISFLLGTAFGLLIEATLWLHHLSKALKGGIK